MKRCLYISYDGLLDPLGQSQILPYIESLNNNGYRFIIMSYEKIKGNKVKIKKLKRELNEKNIIWKYFPFRKGKLHFFYRMFMGVFYINFIHFKKKIDLVHLRGGYPGLIYFISFCRNKYLYDLRAFWGQWSDGGRTKENSFTYKLLLMLERKLINHALGIVVLDKSGKDYIQKNFNYMKPLTIIPTSTNIKKYKLNIEKNKSSIKFVYLGGAEYPPYKIIDALKIVKELMHKGLNCEIDFINKNDHVIIKNIIENEKFNDIKYSIIALNHKEVVERLPLYDIGLIFLEKGKWIRMSSPTKIGEYLAAGLIVFGNKNIAVLDRLSEESESIEIIDIKKNEIIYESKRIEKLLKKINNIKFRKESRRLAEKYYSLSSANEKYLEIYKKLI